MKNILITPFLFLIGNLYAQVGVGTTSPHPSSALEVSANTGKAFLPARVTLGELFDNTNPVNNPAEGLIVYNVGGTQMEGFYIWNKGLWSAVAASANSVSNAVVTNNTSNIMLTGLANGVFQTMTGGSMVFSSITGVSYDPLTGSISLPAGKYSVTVALNIAVPDEAPSSGLGSTIRTHVHYYEAKLTNTSGTVQYGSSVLENATSNASADKKHTANFSFSVELISPTTLTFKLSHHTGGTYENGLGGISPNNGRITVSNSLIHVQKSL